MIESAQPGRCIMATVARRCCNHVCGSFTHGNGAVMTVLTHIRGLAVIKGRRDRGPHGVDMTSLALFAGQRMRGRFIGPGTGAIVTARRITRSRGLAMVKWTD